jgi:hypothetical protein
MRHDAHRWVRQDADRWLRPGFESALPTLDRKYSEDQPRVPAGNPGGGRWTSDTNRSMQGADDTIADDQVERTVVHDEAATQLWESIASEYREDGSLARQYIFNRDGSAIRSEFSVSGEGAGWDERHSVVLQDGSITTFENSGSKQVVFDGEGRVLGTSVLTPQGIEPEATVQLARAPGRALEMLAQGGRAAIAKGVEAAATLFTWLSSRNIPNETAALFFRAESFQSSGEGTLPFHVGQLSENDTRSICPKMDVVQSHTDEAAREIRRADYSSAATYGTAVHTALRDRIRNLQDSTLMAERSFLKEKAETGIKYKVENQDTTYGQIGSLRIDVLEHAENKSTCVYDIKTGKSTLSGPRIAEMVKAVYLRFPQTRQMVVIETRPR